MCILFLPSAGSARAFFLPEAHAALCQRRGVLFLLLVFSPRTVAATPFFPSFCQINAGAGTASGAPWFRRPGPFFSCVTVREKMAPPVSGRRNALTAFLLRIERIHIAFPSF